jgi:hypothetical protein
MRKITRMVNWGITFLLVACAGVPTGIGTGGTSSLRGNSEAKQAENSAQAAVDALNNGGWTSGNTQKPAQPAQNQQNTPPVTVNSGTQPLWVSQKSAVYSESNYISETGSDPNQSVADQKALANLTAFFGRNVQWDSQTMTSYVEVMSKGITTANKRDDIQDTIQMSTQLDTLVGAKIEDRWFDSKNKLYYSIAVMDKAKTGKIYTDIINSNTTAINTLVSFSSDAAKNSFDGYLRYQRAALIADANQIYANVLSVVGDAGNIRATLKPGADYRNEAKTIIAKTPITVIVSGDRDNRIQSAFSKSITAQGFRTGGTGSRYKLAVNFSLSEAVLNNPNKFSRYTADASLIDTLDGNELIRYKIEGREGHTTLAEAENRATSAAEKRVGDSVEGFGRKLSDYLSSL